MQSCQSMQQHNLPFMASSYIPGDLLILILRLLTVKTLLKLKRVCKSWKNLIDSTSFILHHLVQTQTQTPAILVHQELANFSYILIDPKNHRFYNTITGPHGIRFPPNPTVPFNLRPISTIHGVVCLYDFHNKLLLLWNPSIHRHVTIPLPVICLNFDQRGHYCGFWIDPFTKQFKVVIFCFKRKTFALYVSKKKEWVQFAMSPDVYANYCQSPQVLIDKIAYWTATSITRRVFIVFYDFGKDESGKIDKLPKVKNKNMHGGLNAYVSKWCGLLAVVYTYKSDLFLFSDCECDVWVLMLNGSWSNVSSFRLIECVSRVFCVFELEDQKEWVLASNWYGELLVYDREDRKCSRLVSSEKKYDWSGCTSFVGVFPLAYDFVESLVIPDHTW
ncbi:uncharacterized protein [Phyllobates terribilis]|uniref:uncharacterized protein n=1 Tax=Phyllobates terribilis TaxID=111132 RepID=UPI003CCB0E75